jgi:predicted nucleic acid-binding protein
MTTGDKRCFVDTNVLIYSTVAGNPWYAESRHWLVLQHQMGTLLYVTPQILREYLVVLTRGTVFEVQFTVEQAVTALNDMLPWLHVLDEPSGLQRTLCELVLKHQVRGKHIHDANVVAAMLLHSVYYLATYNRADFVVFDEITLVDIES